MVLEGVNFLGRGSFEFWEYRVERGDGNLINLGIESSARMRSQVVSLQSWPWDALGGERFAPFLPNSYLRTLITGLLLMGEGSLISFVGVRELLI